MHNLEEALRKRLIRASWVIYILITTFAFAFLSHKTAVGVMSGGAIALFCFVELRRTLEKAFAFILFGKRKVRGFVIAKYYFKLVLVAVFLTLLLKKGEVDAIGLAIGLLVIPVTVIYAAILLYFSNMKVTAR